VLLLLLLQELGEARRVQEECVAEARRVQDEYQAKVEKIMGQVIAADTSKEHYRQKVRSLGALLCTPHADLYCGVV
jgi:hypothetical protein